MIALLVSAHCFAPSAEVRVPDKAACELAATYFESTAGQAMLVMVDGKVVFERYAAGGGKDRLQVLASGSKSFNGVTAMAAVEDGLLKLDDRACESLTEWKSDPKKSRITYRNLLSLCSGYPASGLQPKTPWKDVVAIPTENEPGLRFVYGAYDFLSFGEALQRKLKAKFGETYEQYMKRRVLDPLGIKLVWRTRCEDGNPQLAGGGAMTARDWATFGEFMRLGGKVGGKQIVGREFLEQCVRSSSANPAYGLTWWLCQPVPASIVAEVPLLRSDMGDIISLPWMPRDMYIAAGAGKQRLYVIPSLKLVAVRMAPVLGGMRFSDAEFLSRLLRGKANDAPASRVRRRLRSR
jgi:CubicO group peptidase (beta-lactamase class C family)